MLIKPCGYHVMKMGEVYKESHTVVGVKTVLKAGRVYGHPDHRTSTLPSMIRFVQGVTWRV
jgi:hypothetical protein